MPRKPGQQKRDAKRKKKRDARHKKRFGADAKRKAAERAAKIVAGGDPGKDLRNQCGYDASHDQLAGWLDIEEQERLDRVSRYHLEALTEKQLPPSLDRHAGLHVAVEDQLVSGKPPQVREALQRLMGDGMSRHDAIHAIGWVLTKHMRAAIEGKQAMDNDGYLSDLESLTLESWLAMAGVR